VERCAALAAKVGVTSAYFRHVDPMSCASHRSPATTQMTTARMQLQTAIKIAKQKLVQLS
jgi:hypothetical protein